MSNSSRIEAATRQHVGAVLTSEQIVELVKLSDPANTKGVYPSDAAYKRTPEGLVHRGKVAYGDGVLEWMGANSFKVLPTEQIVRRKNPSVIPPATTPAPPAPVVASPTVPQKEQKKSTSRPQRSQHRQQATA